MSEESASLILKTHDLTLNTSNAIGTADQFGTSFTWNTINLRVLMGDLYDKYDRFNLCLNTIATTTLANGTFAGNDDRCLYVTIGGLPWINNTYSQRFNTNQNDTVIASFYYTPNAQTTQYYYGNNIATFKKGSGVHNISINFLKILDGTRPVPTANLPALIFMFDIVGVEEYKIKDVTESRIIK